MSNVYASHPLYRRANSTTEEEVHFRKICDPTRPQSGTADKSDIWIWGPLLCQEEGARSGKR